MAAEPIPSDQRPPLDKASRQGQVFAHVNAWKNMTQAQQPVDLDRYLWQSRGSEVQDYAYVAHQMKRYGVKGLYVQALLRLGQRMQSVLAGFAKAGNDRTAAMFLSGRVRSIRQKAQNQSNPSAALARGWIEFLKKHQGLLTHPNYDQINGRPVIYLYSEPAANPRQWAKAVKRIEKRMGRLVWMLHDFHWTPKNVRRWVPVMDGIGQYTATHVWRDMPKVAKVMNRDKWSHKIFEPSPMPKHQSVAQGQTLGDMGYGTWLFRYATRLMLRLDPDSLHVTNWNDFEENSHIAASYLQWDSYLRILRELTADFRGVAPPKRDEPELIVTQKIDRLVGEAVHLEVLSLPIRDSNESIEINVQWVDAAGNVVEAFEPWRPRGNAMAAKKFRFRSIEVHDNLAIYPRITYQWQGQSYGPFRLRPTRLWYGAQPTDLTWITPLDRWQRELEHKIWAARPGMRWANWRVLEREGRVTGDVARPGDVMVAPAGTPETLRVFRTLADHAKGRDTQTRLLLNNQRYSPFGTQQRVWSKITDTPFKRWHDAPLSWISTETFAYDNKAIAFGERTLDWRQPQHVWASRGIYLIPDSSWRQRVTVPVPRFAFTDQHEQRIKQHHVGKTLRNLPLQNVMQRQVAKFRVPFWHYKFERDRGGLAMDHSGYDRHGWLGLGRNLRTFGGVHSTDGPFGFRFEHNFGDATHPIRPAAQLGNDAPRFREASDQPSHLRFDGQNDVVYFPQRTGFPYAETVEIRLRPKRLNREQTVFSYALNYGNGKGLTNKLTIGIGPKGHLLVKAEDDGSSDIPIIRSSTALPTDSFTHVAVVYDGQTVRAFVNGQRVAGQLTLKPYRGLRHYTSVFLGGRISFYKIQRSNWPNDAMTRHFAGDVAEFRMTGRPLKPSEFFSTPSQSPNGS
jgi:hypothetical protein